MFEVSNTFMSVAGALVVLVAYLAVCTVGCYILSLVILSIFESIIKRIRKK